MSSLDEFHVKYDNEWIQFAGIRSREYVLYASGWIGSAAPYTYTINGIGDINRYSNIIVIPGLNMTVSDMDTLKGAFFIGGLQTSSSASIIATGEKPDRDLTIRVIFYGMMTNINEITGMTIPLNLALSVNGTNQLAPIFLPENIDYKSVRYKSSNEAIAKVNPYTGLVTAIAAGTCNITATTNDGSNLNSQCVVTVS